MASTTSWGTRRALGRRYQVDPQLIYELERLQREYELAPGRETRAQQNTQFEKTLAQSEKSLAQNESQFSRNLALKEKEIEGAETAGMIGTAANVGLTAAMIRGLTKSPNEPFFGNLFGGTKSVPSYTPATTQGGMFGAQPFEVNPALADSSFMAAAPSSATTGGISSGISAAETGAWEASAAELDAMGTSGTSGMGVGQGVAAYEGIRQIGKAGQKYDLPGQTLWSAAEQPLTGTIKEAGKFAGIKELEVPAKIEEKVVSEAENFVSSVISKAIGFVGGGK